MGLKVVVFVTDQREAESLVTLATGLGDHVTALVVGAEQLAAQAAIIGADQVIWAEPDDQNPVEAWAPACAAAAAQAEPGLLIASGTPSARALCGLAAAKVRAGVVPRVTGIEHKDGQLSLQASGFNGQVVQHYQASGPVAALYVGPAPEVTATTSNPAAVEPLDAQPVNLKVIDQIATSQGGLKQATRVIAVGRGLKAKADLEMIDQLAKALGAEVGCTMPVADDLHWMDVERYIGRSGQTIAPQLYIALGVEGAPQHMEGVREAKMVVAVNTDEEAMIFRTADIGLVADLYQFVPALLQALDR
ncbi:MAG: electron transfer flavoprotein subunit alpha/FixB family protein [Micrococcales bacterium]|nr:electron transfer flavoprotein subunit alpha/FixB family protein [Micrococcales bacterium]